MVMLDCEWLKFVCGDERSDKANVFISWERRNLASKRFWKKFLQPKDRKPTKIRLTNVINCIICLIRLPLVGGSGTFGRMPFDWMSFDRNHSLSNKRPCSLAGHSCWLKFFHLINQKQASKQEKKPVNKQKKNERYHMPSPIATMDVNELTLRPRSFHHKFFFSVFFLFTTHRSH